MLMLGFIGIYARQYVGKADFLVFRAMDQHGFLGQLQEKKLVSQSNKVCVKTAVTVVVSKLDFPTNNQLLYSIKLKFLKYISHLL